ncbi:hypothetical protein CO174_03935 [Candidatus Uhrbacteria bacterium CG_4_9_14_3_um_filter_50_9]|uniref:Methyltransferase type 11 domain-containing protein n=1 Tax=Candidatus Uhrbacteria bacterium CG_4_9_14_3_um_filter_50_9 TaxID=1975035 RepID=A0A2M7XC70_9BACT|nr:MAG: hypothetical protein CO174_03935 [Candidatus Uhrbacteria bacterium CG_4_9_14_3_um_filter_50_9]
MGIGDQKIHNHKEGFEKEIANIATQDPATFFNWFNESGGDLDANFLKGQCEFSLSILLPIFKVLKHPKTKTALEIGYGGGRLLAAASDIFKEVIGIDVHANGSIVKAELEKRNKLNVSLIQNDGKHIPVGDASVDLVYSFIVLQHVEKIEIFDSYITEAYRVLREGGYAVICFARLSRYSVNKKSRLLYLLDRYLEKLHRKPYKEILARVNCVNLTISMKYAKEQVTQAGFTILSEEVSRKLPGLQKYGGQYCLVLQK